MNVIDLSKFDPIQPLDEWRKEIKRQLDKLNLLSDSIMVENIIDDIFEIQLKQWVNKINGKSKDNSNGRWN